MGWICLGLIIYLHSGWPEAIAVPDKSADQICNLLIDEIFPRHGQVLELCRDNGTENINYKVKETLEALNIHHVVIIILKVMLKLNDFIAHYMTF